jgi:hypothetical protein
MRPSAPAAANEFLAPHVSLLLRSLRGLTGRELVDPHLSAAEQARALYEAPFVVVSHDTAPDPVFNYANRSALELWEMSWEAFTRLPSRLSAEPLEQTARARFLAEVAASGFVTSYAGVRVSRTGRRFRIEDAVVWNVLGPRGRPCGQAATFARWVFLPAARRRPAGSA